MLVAPLFAEYVVPPPWSQEAWSLFAWHVFQVLVYVLVGLVLFGLTYLAIDKFTTFSLRKELLEDQNVALGVLLGGIFLAVALILSSAIRG